MTRCAHADPGITIVELLVAMTITIAVAAAAFSLLVPASRAFQSQPDTQDLQQRLRVAVDALRGDLVIAGAGMDVGGASGSLVRYLAPIRPYRIGDVGADPPRNQFYRADTISLVAVPSSPAQATIARVIPSGGGAAVEVRPNCGPLLHDRVCGFRPGTPVLLFDRAGRAEIGTVASVNGLIVQVDGGGIRAAVDAADGAAITEIAVTVYSLGDDPVTRMPRLMLYDGRQSNQPLVDHVVKMAFEYFGDAQPPALLPGVDLGAGPGPWTTYGPKPPADGVDGPDGAWGPGANCTFADADGARFARLAPLGPPGVLVPLDPAMLTDGPWCPSPVDPDRFDADLLRIRRVRVTLRLQVAAASLRGSAGAGFLRAGSATAAGLLVPDQQIQFDVSPRNMRTVP